MPGSPTVFVADLHIDVFVTSAADRSWSPPQRGILRPLNKLLSLVGLGFPGIVAATTWPCFSVTSFHMLRRLEQQGLAARTVIDVGANIGQFAIAAARLLKPAAIHSFEPEPETHARLAKHLAGIPGARAVNKALGDTPGRLSLHRNAHRHSSSLLRLADAHREAFPFAEEQDNVSVEMSTLDAEFGGLDLPGPVLLKIDVQGYEDMVLAGGADTLVRVDWLIMEVSFKPMYEGEVVFADLLPKMAGRGFRFVRPVGWLEAPQTGEILQMDALFARQS